MPIERERDFYFKKIFKQVKKSPFSMPIEREGDITQTIRSIMRTETISTGSTTVDRMVNFPITGNIIPEGWYNTIKFESGLTDYASIIVLADIVYWYRPKEIRNKETGELIGYEKKFADNLLQRNYPQLMERLKLTRDQAERTVQALCDFGVITKIFKTIDYYGQKLPNVMYLDLNVDKLWEITYPDALPDSNKGYPPLEQGTISGSNRVPPPLKQGTIADSNGVDPLPEQGTNTETTTEITTENTSETSINHQIDDDEKSKRYERIIKNNIAYDSWMTDADPFTRQWIDSIITLMLEVITTKNKTIRIGKEEKNAEVVKSVFIKLTREHITHVLQQMEENTSQIRNTKAYLLTVLYNAPKTITRH